MTKKLYGRHELSYEERRTLADMNTLGALADHYQQMASQVTKQAIEKREEFWTALRHRLPLPEKDWTMKLVGDYLHVDLLYEQWGPLKKHPSIKTPDTKIPGEDKLEKK